ncbi:helix-turn-helix transcriptional regulator [Arthrobacter sp. M2012083]|uniref:helix-turn-helix transcriptional regulator n=1 Tax=Arthrobacter sp. M2012083 TaxID=1197706 RepID=UPI0009FFE62A|nr:helix-turn-helix transcriptional regulator [Arthrobacter sp. M2012083]
MKNNLAERCTERRWTQADLAALGVSRQTVISIEREKFDPSLPLAFLIARTFNCAIEDFFYCGLTACVPRRSSLGPAPILLHGELC